MGGEWNYVSLGDGAKWMSGGTPPKTNPDYWGGDIPWISAKSMYGSRLYDSNLRLTDAGLREGSRIAPKNSTLLLVRGSMLHQRIPVGIAVRDVAFNQDVKALIPKTEFLPLFFYYCFAGKERELLAAVENTGIGAGKLDSAVLRELEFPCPSLEEQKAIAHILGSLDDKIELNRRMNQTLEAMAQALFKSWFVDFDPVIDNALAAGKPIPDALHARAQTRQQARENATPALPASVRELFPSEFEFTDELGWVPKGWAVVEAGSVLNRLQVGKRYKKNEVSPEGVVPVWEQGADIFLGYHDGQPDQIASSDSPKFIFGDHTCITHICIEPFSVSENVIVLEGNGVNSYWAFHAIHGRQKFEEYRRHWMELKIKNILTASGTLSQEFSKRVEPNYRRITSLRRQSDMLSKLRDTLLPKLISGELRIPDAEKLVGEAGL